MKARWILLGAGIATVLAGSGLTWKLLDTRASIRDGEEAKNVASSPPRRDRVRRAGDGPLVQNIDGLLADGSPEAWGKIVSLYPGSSEEEKRRVLLHIAKQQELERVIGYLLATVGEDPTPPDSDPMIDEATAVLQNRWKTPDDFDYGRRMMVMQKTDKRRLILASGLVAFAKNVGQDSPFHPMKGALEAKLIDVHSDIKDPFVKSSIVSGVRSLGGRDAALIMANGSVRDDELETLNETRAAADQALGANGANAR